MGFFRFFGDVLLYMIENDIWLIGLFDFIVSLVIIRLSVSKVGLKEYEDWVREFGECGG